jgi:hypothetical protein
MKIAFENNKIGFSRKTYYNLYEADVRSGKNA